MNPFSQSDTQSPPSFSLSSPLPTSATLPPNSFGDLPDSDDPFGIKAPISHSGVPPRIHQGFDLLDDVTFGFGLVGPLSREGHRQLDGSSPEAGSLSGGSNAPSPSHVDATTSSPFTIPDLNSERPDHTSPSIFASSRQVGSDGQVPFPRQKRKYLNNDGHEYFADAEDPKDMLDDLLNGVNNQMLNVDHLGMSGLARRISRDSQSSWESSGAEDDTSWSGSYNGDHHTPYLSPHVFDHSVDAYASSAPGLFRSLSHRSDRSASTNGEDFFFSSGVDPHVINPNSLPVSPARRPYTLGEDGALAGMWCQTEASRSVDALADGLSMGMGLQIGAPDATQEEGESTLRAKDKSREGVVGVWNQLENSPLVPMNPTGLAAGLSSSLPSNGSWLRGRAARGARPSDRSLLRSSPVVARPLTAKPNSMASLTIADYATMPTKRSRGRRPAVSSDIGLAPVDGTLAPGMQAVPGGSAFDPQLNPGARAIEFCQTTKTGKPKKIFVCQVVACGKVFKRGEHLKRHVRSIHTDDKPFRCPWPTCCKMFNRHDNLNQHLRVHRVSDEGGHVLQGLSVGSDGVLRRDEDGERVDAVSIGLNDVELMHGPIPLLISISVDEDDD